MKHQQGAALVIVMALLSGSLLLGVSSMNSALIDERLASNYRSSVQAQMTAENIVSALASNENKSARESYLGQILHEGSGVQKLKGNEIAELLSQDTLHEFVNELIPEELKNDPDAQDQVNEIRAGLLENLVVDVEVDTENQIVTITARDEGLRNSARRSTSIVYAYSSGSSVSTSPFQTAIVGCEGVTTSGGPLVSSYRSSEGPWNGQPGSFAERKETLIRTTSNDANIELSGGGEVHGGVEAIGKVYLDSVGVQGNVIANGNVTSINSQDYPIIGNVESMRDIIINNTTQVIGHVKAEGNINTSQWDFSVMKSIYAGGEINSPRHDPSEHLAADRRDYFFPRTSPELTSLEPEDCDTFDFSGNNLTQKMSSYQSDLVNQGGITVGSYPNNEWRITPEKIERYDESWNVKNWVSYADSQENFLLGKKTAFYRLDDLTFTNSPVLRISGGDVVLVIDGNFITGNGGGNINGSIVIDDDSSLTIFVGGKVSLGSNVKMSGTKTISPSGRPTFSIFSNYDSDGVGINIDGGGRVVANVYAPFTKATINSGGGLFGSIRARHVDISDGGTIVYDEDLMNAFGSGSSDSGEPGSSVGSGGDWAWDLIDWR